MCTASAQVVVGPGSRLALAFRVNFQEWQYGGCTVLVQYILQYKLPPRPSHHY